MPRPPDPRWPPVSSKLPWPYPNARGGVQTPRVPQSLPLPPTSQTRDRRQPQESLLGILQESQNDRVPTGRRLTRGEVRDPQSAVMAGRFRRPRSIDSIAAADPGPSPVILGDPLLPSAALDSAAALASAAVVSSSAALDSAAALESASAMASEAAMTFDAPMGAAVISQRGSSLVLSGGPPSSRCI